MLFDAGVIIVRNRFRVHIRCRFDILKYHAALLPTSPLLYHSLRQITQYAKVIIVNFSSLPPLIDYDHHSDKPKTP